MTENWVVRIDFKDQSKYESSKGFIKDIIKKKHGLSDFDALSQRWYNKTIPDVEVKRLVDEFKTVGLKVAGSKAIADSLVNYVKDMAGVSITWLDDPIDNEVNEIVEVESRKFGSYISNRVIMGEISKEKADEYIKKWVSVVSFYEYAKRGVEY